MKYVTREHWLLRLLTIPLAMMLLSLALYPGVVINFWNTRGWFARILMVVMLPVFLGSFIEVFFHRIIFDASGIRQRSLRHLGEIRKQYSELVGAIWKKNENLTLEFSDGLIMKIWWLNADIADILKLLREKSGDNLRIEVK
ncbi:MAG TPA: hypothetical protein VJU86_19560 [Pyrinomonadaceae bacterium]|nr:hypothetical protein [Pyrinomonadaceae bacterium]